MQIHRDIYPKEHSYTTTFNNNVKIRLLKGGFIPTKATKGSIGYDLYAIEDYDLNKGETKLFKTAIKVFLPEGSYATIEGRSGLNLNGIITLRGIIDTDYVGELGVILVNFSKENYYVKRGDRIAQILFHKVEGIGISKDVEQEDVIHNNLPKKKRRDKKIEVLKKKLNDEIIEDEEELERGEGGFGSTGK